MIIGGSCTAGTGLKVLPCNDKSDGLTWELSTYFSTTSSTIVCSWEKITKPTLKVEWPSPRHCNTMAALTNGKPEQKDGFTILMLGGLDGSSNYDTLKETWTYGPISRSGTTDRTWVQHKPAATPLNRAMFAIAQIPNTNAALLFGGSLTATKTTNEGGCGNSLDNSTWVFNGAPSSDVSWNEIIVNKTCAKKSCPFLTPAVRQWHTMAGLSSKKVLLFGGMGGCAKYPTLKNDTWIYNHVTKGWSKQPEPKTKIIDPRQYHAMAQLKEGIVILFGGVKSSTIDKSRDQMARGTFVFDEKLSEWKNLSYLSGYPPPCPRLNHAMVQLTTGTILMMGGADGLAFSSTSGTTESRNYKSDTWTLTVDENGEAKWNEVIKKKTLVWPPGRMDHALASIGANKVLLYGGCTGDRYHSG